jgi:hypothetical protein
MADKPKKRWMQKAVNPAHKGAFTAKAKAAGMGVQEYANKVTSEGSHADTTTKRQAAFAKAASSVASDRKERRRRVYGHPSSQRAMKG